MSTANSHNGASPDGLSIQEAAEQVGVAVTTLRRWARDGLLPRYDGSWSPAVVSHAKIVARLRDRGHSLNEIRQATQEGRLAYGYIEELFDGDANAYTPAQASRETGLEPALIARVLSALGTAPAEAERISAEDLELLRYVAAVLDAGLPLVALLQLVRVYGQAMARVADAEVRLFHLYVHEPLMRSGATGVETADEMLELTRQLLPLASPVIKTIGDEAMIVGSDPAALTEWAVGFQQRHDGNMLPRIAVHYGVALYRDGEYYGRDVNIASRVGARAAGSEVLVTRTVVEHARGRLEFDRIADVRLKGFNESTEIFIARERKAA
jgi:class 3 adenylate cyclase